MRQCNSIVVSEARDGEIFKKRKLRGGYFVKDILILLHPLSERQVT